MEFENAYGIRRAGKMFSGRRGRRTERRRGALVFAVAMSIGGLAYDARPQASVPVYQVVQSGATAAQAASLANALNLPANSLAQSNGMVLYADPSNYVAVPTAEVTDPTITSNLLATTRNLVPAIPIEIRAVDFGALSNLTVLDDAPALNLFSNALMSAGLNLTSAVPVVSHRVFTFYYTNDEANVLSNSQPLDTTIHYQFSLGGYPLIGPGAQVQASYGGDGNVSRLSYAARQLQAGPTVRLVPPSIAAGRFASMFPSNAVVSSPQLVYWSPPFLPWFNGAGNFNPAMILPWYACHATLYITNPATAMVTPVRLKPRMIPGTDDPRFVPSVSLTVTSPAPGQVVANASVTGGTPPYTFIWSASDPEVSSNTGPAIAYSPRLRVPPPPLSMSVSAGPAPQLTISWPASPFSFHAGAKFDVRPARGRATLATGRCAGFFRW